MTKEKSHFKDFNDIYVIYYPKLVRFATRYVVTHHEAENIVQNIFLDLLEKKHVPCDFQNLNAYLFRAIKNRCIDHLRNNIRQENKKRSLDDARIREFTLKIAAIERFDEFDHSPEALEQRIACAVNELPEKCRKVFIMSREEGMMHTQIADLLGISTSTVNNQITKALRKFREDFSSLT
jgi:RNA polymerase sigma-70 factor (ECF subfamily)